MKRINMLRGQAPRKIRTGNTTGTGTGFGGIVLGIPTILVVFLLGAVLIACPEAGSSGGSQATLETTTEGNVIIVTWQASAGASGYIVTATNDQKKTVFRETVASVADKKEYTLDIPVQQGTHTVTVSAQKKPNTPIATSNPILVTTKATPPGNLSITKSEAVAEGISITWTAPSAGTAHNGSAATITGYTIYWQQGKTVGEYKNDGNKSVDKAEISTTITVADDKLLGNSKYAIIVVAENTAGLRKASDPTTVTIASQATAPSKPGTPTLLRATGSSLKIQWTAPATLGKTKEGKDAEITGYTVYYKADATTITAEDIKAAESSSKTTQVTQSVTPNPSTATEVTLSGLLGATKYVIAVVAKNSGDESSRASAVVNSETTSAATASSKPGTVTLRVATATSLEIQWDAPTDAGKKAKGNAAAIIGYTVYYAEGTTAPDTNTVGTTVTSTSHTFTGLDGNTAYTFIVKATNSAGLTTLSEASSGIATASAATAPSKPGKPTLRQATGSSLEIQWDAPTKLGKDAKGNAAAIIGYTVYYAEGTTAPDTNTGGTTATSTSHTFTGLDGNTAYTFIVKARNSALLTSLSSQSFTTTTLSQATAPSKPGTPTLLRATGSSLEIQWDAPTKLGKDAKGNAATITGYTIYHAKGTTAPSTDTGGTTATSTSHTFTGLDGNTAYTFIVKARNSALLTSLSSQSFTTTTLSQATAPSKPGTPTLLRATGSSLEIQWDAPTKLGKDAKGNAATITGYTIYHAKGTTAPSTDTGGTTATSTRHTFTGLDGNTAYTFIVKARNSALLTSLSSQSFTTTTLSQATAPGAPGQPRLRQATGSSLEIQWDAPTKLGKTKEGNNATITGYTVYYQEVTRDATTININVAQSATPNPSTPTQVTLSGLPGVTKYAIAVVAKNSGDESSPLSAVTTSTTLSQATAPSKPGTPTLLRATGSSLEIRWDAPTNPGKDAKGNAATITGYTIYHAKGTTAPSTDTGGTTATSSPHTFTGLDRNTAYTFIVKATNSAGLTQLSEKSSGITTTEAVGIVYKPHNRAHQDKFSLGDYNDTELFKIAGLPFSTGGYVSSGSKVEVQYKITVSAGSASIHSLDKKRIEVPSSGVNKGIVYVGLEMTRTTWIGITDNSITFTVTVYDSTGNTQLTSETIRAEKTPNGSIYSWRGLQNMQDDLGGDYKLENDIEFPAPNTEGFEKFTPVGSSGSPFTGTLNGNNKEVSKLYINHDAQYAGLFGAVKAKATDSVVIKNLELVDPKIISTHGRVGPLVGFLSNGTVGNVHVKRGKVESNGSNVGGLVGYVHSGTITSGTITSSSSSAEVEGDESVGGLVGYNKGTARGYATGAVTGNHYVGGLVGYNSNATATGYATGSVSGSNNVGGLVGYNEGTVRGYATGSVSGTIWVGGLMGYNSGKVTGYALGYVIKKSTTATAVGPGIGEVSGTRTVKVYVGRTGTEAKKTTAGAGDHVGGMAEAGLTGTNVPSVTTSNGAAPQGVVIEGAGTNKAKTATAPAEHYSKNRDSFTGFSFGTKTGEWTLGTDDNWPTLTDFVVQNKPRIPAKPTQQDPNDATKTLQFYE